MAKVHTRKARKDYPANGIKKGDTYYFVSLKTGRGGVVKRSLTPFKPSQLTTSAFQSAVLGAQESWEASDQDVAAARELEEAIREAGTEAQESFDNMPEGLQQGETGQLLEERATACESVADQINDKCDELEGMDEPEAPDEPVYTEEDVDGVSAADANEEIEAEYESAKDTYETEKSEYEDAHENFAGEITEILGELP